MRGVIIRRHFLVHNYNYHTDLDYVRRSVFIAYTSVAVNLWNWNFFLCKLTQLPAA